MYVACIMVNLHFFPKVHVCIYIYIIYFVFLGPHLWHMEVPKLGIELELHYSHRNVRSELCHGNAGSLTHCVRPGIEPVSSKFMQILKSIVNKKRFLISSLPHEYKGKMSSFLWWVLGQLPHNYKLLNQVIFPKNPVSHAHSQSLVMLPKVKTCSFPLLR